MHVSHVCSGLSAHRLDHFLWYSLLSLLCIHTVLGCPCHQLCWNVTHSFDAKQVCKSMPCLISSTQNDDWLFDIVLPVIMYSLANITQIPMTQPHIWSIDHISHRNWHRHQLMCHVWARASGCYDQVSQILNFWRRFMTCCYMSGSGRKSNHCGMRQVCNVGKMLYTLLILI